MLKAMYLNVKTGEVMALVGANAADKSTLLSLLSGAEVYRSRLTASSNTCAKAAAASCSSRIPSPTSNAARKELAA